LSKNKLIRNFLLRFILSYALLYLTYAFYLKQTQETASVFACAPITQTVAKHTEIMASFMGYDIITNQNTNELSLSILINNKPVLRLIEGCNGISIIILFIAFIIAFRGKLKTTIGYAIMGSLIIYILNIFRIVVLTVTMLKFPKQQDFLHQIVFPLFIYGIVLLLWVIWVNQFALKPTKNA
jgi:exosortase family protein XrtF